MRSYCLKLQNATAWEVYLLQMYLNRSLLSLTPSVCHQVDAALDLSHTQNIGHMIKTHFPFSQFIVVSLKEGMFSNANVIFRTKFVDGVFQCLANLQQPEVGSRPTIGACFCSTAADLPDNTVFLFAQNKTQF